MTLLPGDHASIYIQVDRHGPATVLTVKGEIVETTLPTLVECLEKVLKTGSTRVVVDLAEVYFLTFEAIDAFIRWHRLLASQHGALVLACLRPRVIASIRTKGVASHLACYADQKDAVAALLEGGL